MTRKTMSRSSNLGFKFTIQENVSSLDVTMDNSRVAFKQIHKKKNNQTLGININIKSFESKII